MIYRTNATELREEEERQDRQELEELRSTSLRRRRRVAIAVTIIVLGACATFVSLVSFTPASQTLHCRHVQIALQNVPDVPGPGWMACGWR